MTRGRKLLNASDTTLFLEVAELSKVFKIAGIGGVATPIVSYVCIFSAIASWPQFSWVENALSDLGVQQGITAPLFNVGLVASGFLSLVFAVGLFRLGGKSLLSRVGAVVFVLACVSLIGIGVFNESFSPTHFFVSVAFFVLLPVSLLVFVGGFWFAGRRRAAIFTLVVAFAAAVPWVLQFGIHYVSNVAVPEFVSSVAGTLWMVVLSFKMLKEPSL